MDHGHIREVREWSPDEPGALGTSEYTVRAVAREIVEKVLTPEERSRFYSMRGRGPK